MKIIKVNKDNQDQIVRETVKVLNADGLVIYPTETCYGVGVDVTNKKAVEKLLAYKRRPEGKAISIAVSDMKMAKKYVEVNEMAENIYQNFLPGPITVISKSKGKAVKSLEKENGTLGIRIPDYTLMIRIIELFKKPITATSANSSGKKTPYKIADVLENISQKQKKLIDLIIDAGELAHNPPSTVVDTTLNELSIIREGKLDLKQLAGGRNITSFISSSEKETQKIGEKLMKKFIPRLKDKCIVFALQGELGVGKTQFAKGVGKALGIKKNIKSPTFTLMHEYNFKLKSQNSNVKTESDSVKTTSKNSKTKNPNYKLQITNYFYHIDTWRMREGKELLELGYNEMLKPGNIIAIEWLEKVKGILEKSEERKDVKIIWVGMEYKNENKREIKILR